MTENNRFIVDDGLENVFCWEINDKENEDMTYGELVKHLNELNDENKELQFQCNLLREQSNEFHRGARENANRVGKLKRENKELQEFKDKVFNLIDKTIEDETQIAENIESTIEGDYVKAVNRLTIIAFENLKKELSE